MQDRSDPDTFNIFIATDNHLGFKEGDAVRGDDAFNTMEEIFQLAQGNDMLLLGGDLFHDNKPSRHCMHRTLKMFRQYCLGDNEINFNVVSDPVRARSPAESGAAHFVRTVRSLCNSPHRRLCNRRAAVSCFGSRHGTLIPSPKRAQTFACPLAGPGLTQSPHFCVAFPRSCLAYSAVRSVFGRSGDGPTGDRGDRSGGCPAAPECLHAMQHRPRRSRRSRT
jgi:hypothetical protein